MTGAHAARLEDYRSSAYLFHGSERAGLARLEPAEPDDAGHDPTNKQRAVYATDDVCAAIMFSLTRGITERWRLTFAPTTAHFPGACADRLRRNVGSLYVLARAELGARAGWQYKACVAVSPIAELGVSLDDYLWLGGLLRFT